MKRNSINFHFDPMRRMNAESKSGIKSKAFGHALWQLEFYLEGLITQWNRIVEDIDLQSDALRHRVLTFKAGSVPQTFEDFKADFQLTQENHNRLYLDIHLYLICWDKVRKFFEVISDTADKPCVRTVWNEIQGFTEKVQRARGLLEHLDEHSRRGGGGLTGFAIDPMGGLNLNFSGTRKNGKSTRMTLDVGVVQVGLAIAAYEKVLSCIQANTSPTTQSGTAPSTT